MSKRARNGRGGWRPGAGRPRLVQAPQRVSLDVESETYDALARLADDARQPLAAYVRALLEQHVRSHRPRG